MKCLIGQFARSSAAEKYGSLLIRFHSAEGEKCRMLIGLGVVVIG